MRWDDVNARVRGLSLHLLGADRLAALAAAPDLRGVILGLVQSGYPGISDTGSPGAPEVDAVIRRVAGVRLSLLARWCGPRTAALAAVYDGEDRRSVRALARGAVEGAPPYARLATLIPTPSLPARALDVLARLTTPGAIGATLAGWGHPFAAPLLATAGQERPDLFAIDVALGRCFAERAVASVRPAEPRLLRDLRIVLDLENLRSALLIPSRDPEAERRDCWIPGGQALSQAAFLAALEIETPEQRLDYLRRVTAPSWLGKTLRQHRTLPAIERAVFAFRRQCARLAGRLDPLGPLPVLGYALAVEQEVQNLRLIVWGRALGAPVLTIRAGEAA
jgi:vacuolar-type H+-ATPase subunit C/Vma6